MSDAPSCSIPQPVEGMPREPLVTLQGIKAHLYIKSSCPHCRIAVQLLKDQQVDCSVVDVTHDPVKRKQVSWAVGDFPTVPMVFLDYRFVGGCDSLQALLRGGDLSLRAFFETVPRVPSGEIFFDETL